MAYIDNPEIEEKFYAAGIVVLAVAGFFLPPFVLWLLGLEGVWAWIHSRPGLIRWPVVFILWGASVVLILGMLAGLVDFGMRALARIVNAIEWIAALTAAGLNAAVFGSVSLMKSLFGLALHPVRCLCEWGWDRGQTFIGLRLQKWREEQELRRLYHEFRGGYRSFREFRRDFEGGGAKSQAKPESGPRPEPPKQEPPKPDPFAAACRLLGLPENGSFTAADLKTRYRALMKGLHPDIAGPNELAVQINAACTLIRTRKGWS
jgi:hypothetical protein